MNSEVSFGKNYVKPVVTLVVICLIVGGLLAVINHITAPVIAANEEAAANETYYAVLPDADGFTEIPTDVEGVKTFLKATNDAGYVVIANGQGYGGQVPVAVSLDNDGRMIKMVVMDNNETPGLGSKVMDEEFTSQFSGMEAKEFTIDDIDAVSGATISSRAVVKAMNRAIEAYNSAR